jgi:carbamoyl-phosphate synthase small subunit
VCLTYPHIGNVGANADDEESRKPYIEGLVVREFSSIASNWRSIESAHKYLERYGVPVIWDIDTRALVLHLRRVGALRGVLATDDTPAEQLIAEARALPTMAGQELASRVTAAEKYEWALGSIDLARPLAAPTAAAPAVGSAAAKGNGHGARSGPSGHGFSRAEREASQPVSAAERTRYRVVAYDFGIKLNILRLLVDHSCQVTVVPATMAAEDVLSLKPDGVFLSNGPGDPEPMTYAIGNIEKLVGRVPIFGICLGHQLCGLALGGKTFKLKFGHHGSNHPVKNLLTGKVEITAQNHGFCVDPDSLPASDAEVTHLNLNDHTNEGLRHRSAPLFSVQYHPEASPGPHDARYLFDDFMKMMKESAMVPRK